MMVIHYLRLSARNKNSVNFYLYAIKKWFLNFLNDDTLTIRAFKVFLIRADISFVRATKNCLHIRPLQTVK